jgi:hypothetical protein
MNALCLFLLVLFSTSAFAAKSLTSQIHDIDYGRKSDDEVLILLKSGHVIKVSNDEKKLLPLSLSSTDENWYKFTIDDERYLLDWERSQGYESDLEETLFSAARGSYVPTTIASMDVAQKYHREARRGWTEDAQCFNKGQVWSYEWWRKHSLKSMKLYIFFTRNYIRKYNFEWWFHVAPYVHVLDEGKVVERVMDIKYTRNPLPFKRWSDIFMRNDAACRVITKYSDYADYPYTGQCYFIRANMYMYQPADLEMQEAWGYSKDAWLMNEVKGAYEQAYKMSI